MTRVPPATGVPTSEAVFPTRTSETGEPRRHAEVAGGSADDGHNSGLGDWLKGGVSTTSVRLLMILTNKGTEQSSS